MPSRRYQRYDRDDDDGNYSQSNYVRNDRSGEVRSYRRDRDVQDVSYSEMDNIRQQGLAGYDARRGQGDMSVVRRSQTRDVNGDSRQSYEQRITRRRGYSSDDDDNRNYYRSRRRDSAPDYGRADGRRQGQYRNDRDQQSQVNGRDRQVAPYQRQRGQEQQQQQNTKQGEEEEEEDFFSRHFDTGSDGLITALAGGALGAITARHLTAPNHFAQVQQDSKKSRMRRNWRTIAGAVAGAVALNAAETGVKNYFEEEHKEHMADGGEFVGEVLGAVGPDVI